MTAPWMAPLSEGSRTAIKELVDASPPLTHQAARSCAAVPRANLSPGQKRVDTQVEDAGEAQLEGGAP